MKKVGKVLLGLATLVTGVLVLKRIKDVRDCDVEEFEPDNSGTDESELDEDDICYDIEEDFDFGSSTDEKDICYDIEEDLDFSSCESKDDDTSICKEDDEIIVEDTFIQVCGVTRESAIDDILSSNNNDFSSEELLSMSDNDLAEVYAIVQGY